MIAHGSGTRARGKACRSGLDSVTLVASAIISPPEPGPVARASDSGPCYLRASGLTSRAILRGESARDQGLGRKGNAHLVLYPAPYVNPWWAAGVTGRRAAPSRVARPDTRHG